MGDAEPAPAPASIPGAGQVRRGRLRPGLVASVAVLALIATWLTGLAIAIRVLIGFCALAIAARALAGNPSIRRVSIPMPGQLRVEARSGTVFTGPVRAMFASPFWCAFVIEDPAGRSPVLGLFPDELDAASWRRLLVAMRSD